MNFHFSKEELKDFADRPVLNIYDTAYDVVQECIATVENQPSAYYVEKVVAEIKEASYQEAVDDMDAFGDIPSMVVSLKTATSIVRNGGKE